MKHFRSLAAQENIRFIACRRSVCALQQSLDSAGFASADCQRCQANDCVQRKGKSRANA